MFTLIRKNTLLWKYVMLVLYWIVVLCWVVLFCTYHCRLLVSHQCCRWFNLYPITALDTDGFCSEQKNISHFNTTQSLWFIELFSLHPKSRFLKPLSVFNLMYLECLWTFLRRDTFRSVDAHQSHWRSNVPWCCLPSAHCHMEGTPLTLGTEENKYQTLD